MSGSYNLKNLKNKIDSLENLEEMETESTRVLKSRLNLLKQIAVALVEEFEKLDSLKPLQRQDKANEQLSLRDEVRGFEKHLIQSALNQTGGHQTNAAQMLGVSITTLNAKIKRLKISPNLQFKATIPSPKSYLFESSKRTT